MEIAIPLAILPDEQRVALTPTGVQTLTSDGHTVSIEHNAGVSAGFADGDYSDAGAQIVYGPQEIYLRGELLVTVDGVPEAALPALRHGQILCGFLRLSLLPRSMLAALEAAGISTLSYELIQRDDGALPVLLPMSEITGRLLPQLAAHLLETHKRHLGIHSELCADGIIDLVEAGVVTSRYDVHDVVTEYGVAQLYGRTLAQRARALIGVAHPAFRDRLTAAAQQLHYL